LWDRVYCVAEILDELDEVPGGPDSEVSKHWRNRYVELNRELEEVSREGAGPGRVENSY